MVKKSNGQWCMCMDYTNLNKACPKDAYSPPNIDRLVNDATGHKIMSFLYAYSGYNQIPMHEADKPKTAFMTNKSNFCYEVMLFGLKNVRATYQRWIDIMFREQIGRNVEAYIDHMIVKSDTPEQHVADLTEVFGWLREFDMRLNPTKYMFGVEGGKFLGFLLTSRGIKANLDKFKDLEQMRSPKNLKEVQWFIGRLT